MTCGSRISAGRLCSSGSGSLPFPEASALVRFSDSPLRFAPECLSGHGLGRLRCCCVTDPPRERPAPWSRSPMDPEPCPAPNVTTTPVRPIRYDGRAHRIAGRRRDRTSAPAVRGRTRLPTVRDGNPRNCRYRVTSPRSNTRLRAAARLGRARPDRGHHRVRMRSGACSSGFPHDIPYTEASHRFLRASR